MHTLASERAVFALTHDLGAPARHVLAFASLLCEDARLPADAVELLDQIRLAALRSQAMHDALNRLARLGSDVAAPVAVSVAAALDEVPRHADFEVHVQDDATLRTRPALLVELLRELVDNARLYSGQRCVHVSAMQRDRGALLRIADDGPGIDAERWPQLLLPFKRGAACLGGSGLGMGLTVADRIVRMHGGVLRRQPRAPCGWALWFLLRDLDHAPARPMV